MPPTQPNILLIMADQLVAALTGAYGHPVVQTPNLDALAAQGVRFDAAYSSCPLCAPARASLITGRYVSHCKVWDNAAPLGSDVPTVAHYLTLAGYDAVCSGKMHYIGPDQLHGLRTPSPNTTEGQATTWHGCPVQSASRQLRSVRMAVKTPAVISMLISPTKSDMVAA